MEYLFYVLSGIAGGLLSGMGLGGGTVLIPILTVFLSVNQQHAQAINLLSFIPMAMISVVIFIKNKMINYKNVLLIIISGVISSVGGAILAKTISGGLLKRIFGGFLILLVILQIVVFFTKKNK